MIEEKKNKILIYIISSCIITMGITYTASIISSLESTIYNVTIDSVLRQINLFYSIITTLATISCITCYASTQKDELYFTFILFLVFVVDIILGNIDRFYFDGNILSTSSNILIPNSILRCGVLVIMLFNFKKLNNFIIMNKIKFGILVFLIATFLGLCEILKLFGENITLNSDIIFYKFFLVILYFAVSLKYFIIGIKKSEYINLILSSSMFFFGIRWIIIIFNIINNYNYIDLISVSVTLIGFITFIGGVICELLITINKNKELEKRLMVFKEIAQQNKNSAIAIFNENKELVYINDLGKLYLCNRLDVDYFTVEKVLSKKISEYLDDSLIYKITNQLKKYNFWSDSITIIKEEIILGCSIQKIEFENENFFALKFKDISRSVRESRYIAEYKSYKEQEKFRNEFFANISHELRTPLNIFYSTLQLLDKSIENNDNFEEVYKLHRKSLRINSYRMLRLINNIVDISRMDAGFTEPKFVNIDIVRVIEEITLSVVDYAKLKNINITFDTQVEENIINCDPHMIERIMLNLLSNSIKFTNKEGNIFVDIFTNSEFVQIRIKDDGIGIPIEIQDKIFDRFVQGDKSLNRMNEGSGIGLSIVYSMVKLNGGEIYLESDGKNGTEFEIFLPNTFTKEEIKEDYFISKNKIEIEFSDIYELH